MARRLLTLTLTLTLDEDLVRDADDVKWPDGSTEYTATLDGLRTSVHHEALDHLASLDPVITNGPEFEYRGVDYEPGRTEGDVRDVGL